MKTFTRNMVVLLFLFFAYIQMGKAAIDCSQHKIYCKITKIKPKIDKKFAMKLSNLLHKYSKKYGTDPIISVGIIAQESMFRNVITYNPNMRLIHENNKMYYTTPIEDVGYYQFSYRSILEWKLDPNKIISDLDYATKHHSRILKMKMNSCKLLYPKTSWACWHSATERFHKKYVERVRKRLGR